MNLHPKIALSVLAVCLALASDAAAGSSKHGSGKSSKHASVSVGFSKDFGFKQPAPTHGPEHGHFAPPPHHAPPGYYAPTPRLWVPGHYEVVWQKVWVAGVERRVWVEPVFELRYDSCGRAFQFCAAGGHWETVCEPGHYETRDVQVWTPGHWQSGHGGYGQPGC